MKQTLAIWKKELAGFLFSPLAYVTAVLLLGLAGFFYYLGSIEEGVAGVQPMMSILGIALLFTTPLISMKLLAEEKRRGTIELLLSLPVRSFQIVIGKYLAAASVFAMILILTLLHTFILALIGNPEVGVTFSIYLGVFLEGLALLSLGIFVSAITDSQVVAGIGAFGMGLVFFLINILSDRIEGVWGTILGELSFGKHLSPFFQGILDLKDIVFFVLVILLGNGLSIHFLENEKWRK